MMKGEIFTKIVHFMTPGVPVLLEVSVRALIFHMSIPCDKTLTFYPVTLILEFYLFFDTLTLLITFE